MSETKFTKGEWIVYDKNDDWGRIGSDELIIGMSSYNKDYSHRYCCHKILIDSSEEEARANANLIACAPEMYKILSELSSVSGNYQESIIFWIHENKNKVEELLAKARGESQCVQ